MICLGIDVGSTSIKGGVLDLQQQAVREVQQVPFPAPVSGLADPTWFEVEPTQIVDALRTLVNELLDCQPNAQAIFFSGQMGGTILVDRDSGEPLTRYLSWRDQRAEYSLGEMHARLGKSLSLVELGYELKAGSTSALLFWLVRERQLSPRAMPASVADFAIAQLCGERPQMHPTQAIGLLHLETGDWHREALRKLELENICWPKVPTSITRLAATRIKGDPYPAMPLSAISSVRCAARDCNGTNCRSTFLPARKSAAALRSSSQADITRHATTSTATISIPSRTCPPEGRSTCYTISRQKSHECKIYLSTTPGNTSLNKRHRRMTIRPTANCP